MDGHARTIEQYSLKELKELLRGLGGDSKGLLEKSEFVSAIAAKEQSISVKELKAKVRCFFWPRGKSRRFF